MQPTIKAHHRALGAARIGGTLLAMVMGFAGASEAGAHGSEAHPQRDATPSAASTAEFSGVVQTLTVVDRASGRTYRYPQLLLDDGRRVQLAGVTTPAEGASVVATGRLQQHRLQAQSVRVDGTTNAAVRRADGPRRSLEGTLRVFHVDYPDGTDDYGYALRASTGEQNVVDLGRPPAAIDNGAAAIVSGATDARGYIVVDTIEITATPTMSNAAFAKSGEVAATTQGYTVFPLKYPANTAAPWTYNADPGSWSIPTITSAVFGNGTGSAADYYKEVSYGAQLLSGVVANASGAWLSATQSRPTACGTNAELNAVLDSIENNGQAAATAAGFNPNANRGQLYVVDALPCGWLGLGYIGYPLAYVKGTASLIVVGHEIGHNFGLYHAGSLNCGADVVAASGCSVAEYGDPFDIMGNRRAMHFNATQKARLGYFASGSVATHASGTATYTLYPIELPGQSRYAVQVAPSGTTRTYWIEFRQPIGFDAALSGVPNLGAQVRLAYPFENQCSGCDSMSDDTQFLDMTRGTPSSFDDGALLSGKSFTDASNNITISVIGASSASIDVQVSTGGATPTSTSTTLASSANPSASGQSVTFTATVTGNAPTGTVAFKDGTNTISGCSAVALAGSGNGRSAACATSALAAGAHGVVAQYGGDANNLASTSAQVMQTVNSAPATPTSTTTTLGSSANPSVVGQMVTLTATVNGVAPTGTMSFRDGGATIATCGAVLLTGAGNTRKATCTTTALAVGNHALTAQYGGDGANAGSTSAALAQTVNAPSIPIATAVTLLSSSNPAPATGAITLTASVDAASLVPGGTVSFSANGSPIAGCGSVAVRTGGSTGTAQCTTPLAGGAFTVVARYNGSGQYQPSSSQPFAQVKSLPGIGNTIQFAAAAYAVNENAGSVTVTVSRIGDVTAPAVAMYATADGTTTGGEYQATSGTLTWAAQDATPRIITIPILDDIGPEPDKTFTVELTSITGASPGMVTTAVVTIVDDDAAAAAMPATVAFTSNPYGAAHVTGAQFDGTTITNPTRSVEIELGTTAGIAGSFARLDLSGLSVGPGNTLRIRSGAPGQTVLLVNAGSDTAAIAGSIVAAQGNGAPPPVVIVKSPSGMTLAASGRIESPSGLTIDTLGADITGGTPLVNQGLLHGGATLVLKAAKVTGGGLFRADAMTFMTFGNLHNPANGAHYLANGLQLHPASGTTVAVTIAGYGTAAQVYNLMINGNGRLTMPSVWPTGSPLPPNNRPVLPNAVRPAGTPDASYGGGQVIVQAAGTLRLDGGASRDFVFPGGFVLRAGTAIDINGATLVNGWTTSGTVYQGTFLEAPSIVDTSGKATLDVYTNDLNWTNFSVRPTVPVQTTTLRRQGDGSARYVGANALAPHLNFYGIVTEAGAAGKCYACLVNTTVMDLGAPPATSILRPIVRNESNPSQSAGLSVAARAAAGW